MGVGVGGCRCGDRCVVVVVVVVAVEGEVVDLGRGSWQS